MIDRKLASFLAQAYNLKVIADYAVGSDVRLGELEAAEAIDRGDSLRGSC